MNSDEKNTHSNSIVMKALFPILIQIFLLAFVLPLQAQQPKTFYVGHSLSDQIPDMVQSLSNDAVGVDFSWVYQSIPGAPLRWQWERKDMNDYTPNPPQYYGFYDAVGGLPVGDFDVLVLTEAVPRYPAIIDETYEYADSFYHYASTQNSNLRLYIYEVWHCLLSGTPTGCDFDVDANQWRQRLDDDLSMWESIVDTLNARFNPTEPVCLIPAGQGLAALYDSIQIGAMPDLNSIEDLFSDNIHLNDTGKYYIACIHFAMIHETSPVGLTNQLQFWWGGDFDAPSPALALKFQEMAWETVNNYPNTCLDNTTSTKPHIKGDYVTLSPNPTKGIFELGGLVGQYTIQISDLTGRLHQTLSGATNRIEVDIQHLPEGLYFVRVLDDTSKQLAIEKIIKHH